MLEDVRVKDQRSCFKAETTIPGLRSEAWQMGAASQAKRIETESTIAENEKKRPKLLHRITGTFKSEPEPEDVLENRTRKREKTSGSLYIYRHSLAAS